MNVYESDTGAIVIVMPAQAARNLGHELSQCGKLLDPDRHPVMLHLREKLFKMNTRLIMEGKVT